MRRCRTRPAISRMTRSCRPPDHRVAATQRPSGDTAGRAQCVSAAIAVISLTVPVSRSILTRPLDAARHATATAHLPSGPRGRGGEPGASGNPPHLAVGGGDVDVAHDSIPVHEIPLGKDKAAVGQERRSPDAVHAGDGARWTASGRHADQPRVRTPIGAQIGDRPPVRRDGGKQAAARTARQGLRDCHRTVGGKVLRQALPRRLELLGPGLPGAGDRSERASSRVVNRPQPGELPGDLLDELTKRGPAVGPVDVVEKLGAIDVRTAAARPLRRSPRRLTRVLEAALEDGGPEDHVVVRPV